MKKRKYLLPLTTALILAVSIPSFAGDQNQKIKTVKKYELGVSDNLYVPFNNSTDDYFEKGFVTGFGSAITYKGIDNSGNPQFYAITDRGPNADAPKYKTGDNISETKIFPNPEFTPSIGILTIKNGQAFVDSAIEIKDASGKKISGLPLETGLVGSTGETALDLDLNVVGYDKEGLDTEGIAVDKEGNFWICDEYGPFILKLDKQGKILKKYSPGNGLPEILKYRMPNRGFEGLTISPSGKVFASVQSVLDIDGNTSKTAQFTRIIELDPISGSIKTYAYPVNASDYSSPKDCKIGDIYAVNDTTLLVIEQGKLKDKTMSNLIYKVDLSKASDITNTKIDGNDLEYISDTTKLIDIALASKEKLVDLRNLGWTAEKAEGLCLFNNNQSIAVINDNDFGIAMNVSDGINENPDITEYTYDADNKTFTLNEVISPNVKIGITQNTEPSEVWVLEMENTIQ